MYKLYFVSFLVKKISALFPKQSDHYQNKSRRRKGFRANPISNKSLKLKKRKQRHLFILCKRLVPEK